MDKASNGRKQRNGGEILEDSIFVLGCASMAGGSDSSESRIDSKGEEKTRQEARRMENTRSAFIYKNAKATQTKKTLTHF